MKHTKTYKYKTATISSALFKSADKITPYCILTGCVLTISYALELLLGYGTSTTLGETSVSGRIFYYIAQFLQNSLLPIVGGFTALTLSESLALPAGFLGGIISTGGYSFITPQGSINGTSGLFGAVFAGIIAGTTTKNLKTVIGKLMSKKNAENPEILTAVVSLCITVFVMMLVTSFSTILGLGFSFIPPLLMNYNKPLLFIALGIMLNINPGNTIYVAAFAFSSSMLSIGDSSYTAAVASASLSPVVALSISLLCYPDRYSNSQKLCGFLGLIFLISGVNVSTIPFLIKKPLRYSFCFSFGGAVAAMLSYYSGCTLESFEGGFLASQSPYNTLFLTLSVLCGGAVAASADAVFEYLGERKVLKKIPESTFDKTAFQ